MGLSLDREIDYRPDSETETLFQVAIQRSRSSVSVTADSSKLPMCEYTHIGQKAVSRGDAPRRFLIGADPEKER